MIFLKTLLTLALALTFGNPHSDKIQVETGKPLGDVLSISKGVAEFEKSFNKKVLLPTYIPFQPTHSGATVNIEQKNLTLNYYDEQSNKIMIIHVYSTSENKVKFNSSIDEKIKLGNSTDAVYFHRTKEVADRIHFIMNGLEYRVGIKKPVSRETLTRVIDSLK